MNTQYLAVWDRPIDFSMPYAEFLLRQRAAASKQLLHLNALILANAESSTLRTNMLADLEALSRGQ